MKDIKAQINEIRDKYAKTGRLSDKARQRKESREIFNMLATQEGIEEEDMELIKKNVLYV